MSKRNKFLLIPFAILIVLATLLYHIYKVGFGSINTNTIGFIADQKQIDMGKNRKIQVLQLGDKKNPAIVFLHGFPDTSLIWKPIMENFSKKGFFTIAPDQRGYSSGLRPKKVSLYTLDTLVADIIHLVDVLEIERFHLVGHDWGGIVAGALAEQYGNRLLSLSCLSICNIKAYAEAYQQDNKQYEASSYIRFFQINYLSEYLLARNNYSLLFDSTAEYFSPELAKHRLHIFKQEKALTSALNWYRANYSLISARQKGENMNISVPTLILWGKHDPYILKSTIDNHEKYFSKVRLTVLNSGHWPQVLSREEVEQHLLEHISKRIRNSRSIFAE